jgi:hypothetical protein
MQIEGRGDFEPMGLKINFDGTGLRQKGFVHQELHPGKLEYGIFGSGVIQAHGNLRAAAAVGQKNAHRPECVLFKNSAICFWAISVTVSIAFFSYL